jgi:hypothetical protein
METGDMNEAAADLQLTPDQVRTLACVLDELIPPSADGRLRGAGQLGLAAAVEQGARERPELGPGLLEGLAALDERARTRDADGFAGVAASERRALLEQVAAQSPAFLPPLVFQTLVAYYAHPEVLEALGHEPRPPYPKGYDVPATDFSILDPVRGRDPFYRRP